MALHLDTGHQIGEFLPLLQTPVSFENLLKQARQLCTSRFDILSATSARQAIHDCLARSQKPRNAHARRASTFALFRNTRSLENASILIAVRSGKQLRTVLGGYPVKIRNGRAWRPQEPCDF